jgi:hypothetical protein
VNHLEVRTWEDLIKIVDQLKESMAAAALRIETLEARVEELERVTYE